MVTNSKGRGKSQNARIGEDLGVIEDSKELSEVVLYDDENGQIVELVETEPVKELIVLPISEWTDYDVLLKMIKIRYNAELVTRNDVVAIFEGVKNRVELRKI